MIKALGHVWDNGVITQAPKGKKAGIKTYTCTRCNLTKTETAVSPKENTITAEATSTYSRTVKTITVTVKKASAKKGK